MARTRGNGVVVYGRSDAIPTDGIGGYAGGDSTADAIDGVRGIAESSYGTIDNLAVTAEPLPSGVDPTVTITGTMGSKTINFGIPKGDGGGAAGASVRALAPVRAALDAGTLRVVGIGDSNTEGAGVQYRGQRWFDQMVADLRTRVTGGDAGQGWVQAVSLGGPKGFTWTGAGADTTDHVGGKGRSVTGDGKGTYTGSFTTARILYKASASGGDSTGTLAVSVDGGTPTTGWAGNPDRNGTQELVVTAPAGSHTITVTVTSGTVVFYGAHLSTASTGVSGWNMGQSGSRTDTWAYGDPAWGQPDTEIPSRQALQIIQPHLIVIALGANGLGGVWGKDYSPKTYAEDTANLVNDIRAYLRVKSIPEAGFLLITPSQLTDNIGTSRQENWRGFEQELVKKLGSDPLVSILHESEVWQPFTKADPDPTDYLSDTIHWNARGMAAVGAFVKSWVAGGLPRATATSGDASTPHAATHATGGSDPVTPAAIGAPDAAQVSGTFNNADGSTWDFGPGKAQTTGTAVGLASAWIKGVDARVASIERDTGWRDVPLSTGWTGTLKARRIGAVVYVRSHSLVAAAGAGKTIAVLPAGFRPGPGLPAHGVGAASSSSAPGATAFAACSGTQNEEVQVNTPSSWTAGGAASLDFPSGDPFPA